MRFAEAARVLRDGGVVVAPTDTLYGVLGSATDVAAVERIYDIKGRERTKPLIVLIGNRKQLKRLPVQIQDIHRNAMDEYWPGPTTILFPVVGETYRHVDCGTGFLGIRLPAPQVLCSFVEAVGPVVAPSANPAGQEPARTIPAAEEYFGDQVDGYVTDTIAMTGSPSHLIKPTSDGVEVYR